MRRIITVVVVALVVAAMMLAMVMPAFAVPGGAQDDKNNPTFPGTGAGNNPNPSEQAIQNNFENCDKHAESGKGLPAQCY